MRRWRWGKQECPKSIWAGNRTIRCGERGYYCKEHGGSGLIEELEYQRDEWRKRFIRCIKASTKEVEK